MVRIPIRIPPEVASQGDALAYCRPCRGRRGTAVWVERDGYRERERVRPVGYRAARSADPDADAAHKAADRERARCGDPAPPGRRGLRSKRLGMTVSPPWNSDRTLTERTEARLRRRWSPAPP
jgi:hypothetical protein